MTITQQTRIRGEPPRTPSFIGNDAGTPADAAGRRNSPFVDPSNDTPTPPGAPVAPITAMTLTEFEKLSYIDSEPPALPPRQPFYKRRGLIITIIGNCVGIAFLFIMLFPVVRAITQDVVNKATIDITMATISSPTNTSFQLSIQGTVGHTSSIPAVISFPTPVNVSWMDGSTNIPLGYMQLFTIRTSHHRATINQTTTFYVTDEDALGNFVSSMITSQNFTWKLESSDLTVQAEKFPVSHGISFNKLVTMNGINNFAENVQLEELQLPSGNITNGINFVAVMQLSNPSPFALDLGTMVVDLSYQDVFLGDCTSLNTDLSLGNNTVTCNGTFVPQTTLHDIAVVAQMAANYLSDQTSFILATGNTTTQSDGSTVSWLSQGIKNLTLTIPLLPTTPINPLGLLNISSQTFVLGSPDR